MSISVEYCCSRVELYLSLLISWLILPIRWLAILNNRSDIMRKAVRDGLPVSTYGELATTEGVRTTTCAVCLSEVQGKDSVWELSNCSHVFHRGCLDTWLDHDEHLTCPLCRAPLMTPAQAQRGPLAPPPAEPGWAVERLLYLFGDDLPLS